MVTGPSLRVHLVLTGFAGLYRTSVSKVHQLGFVLAARSRFLLVDYLDPYPKGPKYQNMWVYMASVFGIVTVALEIHSVFGYLDP